MIKAIDQKIINFIRSESLLSKGDKVLVAFSGGADSVFLLCFLLKFKKLYNLHLSAFHLNHNLRGKDAVEDEKFCVNFCKKNKVKIFTASKNVKLFAKKNKLSVEEAGRIIRYSELNRVAKKCQFTRIATAHNKNDNAETVLLNLIKGAGLKGVAGIPVKRNNIIRPVLAITKDEILFYLNAKNIPFRFDSSNYSNEFERNFLRNKIIPQLKEKLNPQLDNTLLKSSKIFRNISATLDEIIDDIIVSSVFFKNNRLFIESDKISIISANIVGEFFKKVISLYHKVELSSENINSLTGLLKKQKGRSIEFSNGVTAYRERKYIIIKKKQAIKKNQFKISVGKSKKINDGVFLIGKASLTEIKNSDDKFTEFISADDVKNNFILRTWKNGDRFYPLGMKGSKKISDFLTEQRVASFNKEEQLILESSGKIIWVVGLRIDDGFKITGKTKKILKLCWKPKVV